MTKRTQRKLEGHARLATFAPGELVIRAGDPGDAFYVIVRGRAGVAGQELNRTLREGDYFGEIALIDGGPRSATVIALDELQAIELPPAAFRELLARDPGLARTIMASLAKRVRALEQTSAPRAAQTSYGWPVPGLS